MDFFRPRVSLTWATWVPADLSFLPLSVYICWGVYVICIMCMESVSVDAHVEVQGNPGCQSLLPPFWDRVFRCLLLRGQVTLLLSPHSTSSLHRLYCLHVRNVIRAQGQRLHPVLMWVLGLRMQALACEARASLTEPSLGETLTGKMVRWVLTTYPVQNHSTC